MEEVNSRSQQKRISAMKGESAPTFATHLPKSASPSEPQDSVEIPFCDAPCGHSSQYCYTENAGKNIVCLLCEHLEAAEPRRDEREALDQLINSHVRLAVNPHLHKEIREVAESWASRASAAPTPQTDDKWLRLYAMLRERECCCNIAPEQAYNDVCAWCAKHPEGNWDEVEKALKAQGLSIDEPFASLPQPSAGQTEQLGACEEEKKPHYFNNLCIDWRPSAASEGEENAD